MKKNKIIIFFIIVFSAVIIVSGMKLSGIKHFVNKQCGSNMFFAEESKNGVSKAKYIKNKICEMEKDKGENNLKSGVYAFAYDDSKIGDFTIVIDKENRTFSCYESPVLSYIGMGYFVVEDDVIKLRSQDFGTVNYFRIEEDKLIFVEERSTNFSYADLQDGAEFTYREDDDKTPVPNTNLFLYRYPLEEIPKDYSLEQAKENGCVVFEDSDVTYGEDVWMNFVSVTKTGEPASVRMAYYYTLDEDECSPEYYEAEKDNYPVMYVKDLFFDGQTYTIRWYEDGEEVVRKFKYLIRCDDNPNTEDATYECCIKYILVNDNTVTWDEIFKQLISSSLPVGGGIEYCDVYNDYVWK